MSTPGAACPVCGGPSCKGFPDIEHSADYPFLPGGTVAKTDEETVTATGRLFDADGVLRYRKGQQVPKSQLKSLTERPSNEQDPRPVEHEARTAPGSADTAPVEDETPPAQKAAKKSAKRAPARESR